MAESGSLTVYPGAYVSAADASNVQNSTRFVGKGTGNTTYATIYAYRTTNYAFWPFVVSSIPEDAEIDSVSCHVKAGLYYYDTTMTYTLRLFSGSTAKGAATNVTTKTATIYNLSTGTWTRDELSSIRLKTEAISSSSGANLYLYGADLTVTYTYQSEKFMLKLGGSWTDVARVFKKVSGIWVEQEELANVIEDGVRYKNGGEIASMLPSGYTRLEYIESTGSQYIDTGYKATSENYRIKCKFATTNDETSTVLFGGGASTDIISALLQSTNQVKFYVGSGSVSGATATFVRGAECELECHANTGTFTANLDGVAYSGSYSGAINKDYPLFIFANNVSGSAAQFSSIRLYAFQIYDNGNMVRNLIPCVNATNVAGMYDTVNDVFYQSASGTALIAPSSGSGSTNPSFTIEGTTYYFEEGMTWEDWIPSAYNTAGFETLNKQYVYNPDNDMVLGLSSTTPVSMYAAIVSGGSYVWATV